MVILSWPQANATCNLMRLRFVDKCSEREPFSSTKKNKVGEVEDEDEDCSVSKVELTTTTTNKQLLHHYHQQQQKIKLIMEQNSRITTTSTSKPSSPAIKRSLLHRKLRGDRVEDNIKLSNEEFVEDVEEHNLEDVCGFATTVAIEKQHQHQHQHQQQHQQQRCKSTRFRFEDKVEEGDGWSRGYLTKMLVALDKRGSFCPSALFARPFNKNNYSNYTLSTTHLFLSILIFTLHFSISSCLQPVLSEHKVPLLHHQQNLFQNGEISGNNNHNMIHSKSFNNNHRHYQTAATNQKPVQQFKYHLNHLRPPSLVPITIQQVAANGEYSPDESLVSGTGSSALQASEPEPVLALIESRWSPNAKATQTTMNGQNQLISHSQTMYKQSNNYNNTPSTMPNNDTRKLELSRRNDMRLVQLQLPLQLHLKLKPLPLPMPPPTGRSSSINNQLINTAEKRRRSIETVNVTSNLNSVSVSISPTTTSASTTSTTTDSALAKDRDRRELMAFTWREAKRILLLSSMSPTLMQKKLERRTADFPETAELSTRSAVVGDSASVWVPKVDATSAKAAVTTTTPTFTTSSGMLEMKNRQQVELEQSTTTTTLNPRWKPVQQQQPPTAEPLLPPLTTTYKTNLNLLQTTTPNPASNSTTVQVNLSSLSPSLPQTVAQTTPLPQTTTTSAFTAAATTGKGEVRRQRHSSQLQLQGQPKTPFIDPTTDSRIQALAASMLPFFWPSFQLASHSQNVQPKKSRLASGNAVTVTNWPLTTGITTEVDGPSSSSSPQTPTTMMATSPADAWPLQYLSASTSRAQKLSSPMAASNFVPTVVSLDHESESNNHSGINELDSVNVNNGQEENTTPSIISTNTTTAMPKQKTMVSRKKIRKPNYLTQSSSSPYLDSTRLASRYPMPKIKFQLRETTPLPMVTKSDRLATTDNENQQHPALNQQAQPGFKSSNQASNERYVSSLKSHLAEGKLQHIQVPKSLSRLIENQLLTNASYLLAHHKNHTKHNKIQMAPTTSISKVVRLKNDTDLQIMLQATASGAEQDLKWRDSQTPAGLLDARRATATSTTSTNVVSSILRVTKAEPRAVATTTTISSPVNSLESNLEPTLPPTTIKTTATTLPERISTLTAQAVSVGPLVTSTGATIIPPPATTITPTRHVAQESAREEKIKHATGKRQIKGNIQPAISITTQPSSSTQHEQVADGNTIKQRKQFQTLVKPQLDEMIGSNKVLPEEEDQQLQQQRLHQQQTTSSATYAGTKPTGLAPKKYGSQQGENKRHSEKENRSMQRQRNNHRDNNNNNNNANNNRNIKLFHFKRKPDMAKLPFYKKPLNYTELGWTPEQIQEHLEQSAALLGSIQGESGYNQASLLSTTAPTGTLNGNSTSSSSEEARAELLLLKRKRRGKSQFERLMAELHGSGISNNNNIGQSVTPSSAARIAPPSPLVATESGDDSSNGSSPPASEAESSAASSSQARFETGEQRVPVMKKKVEALVLKPVFFVMNQKRRPTLTMNSSNNSNTIQSSTRTDENSPPQQTTLSPVDFETSVIEKAESQQNRSKPIIRLRRKHHGDQPMTHFRHPSELWQNQQVPWRPSRPFWSVAQSHNSMNDKLMLVPSGLLTPSGSHLVPLYDPHERSYLKQQQQQSGSELTADEQSKLVNDLFAWRPSRAQSASEGGWQVDNQASSISSEPQIKPSGGLAPSGEESFLVAPSAPMASQSDQVSDRLVLLASSMEKQHAAQQQQQPAQQSSQMSSGAQQAAMLNQKESDTGLRVPRLLVKPMRPAKYSLNGYIPKPSLTVTGVQAQLAQPTQQQTPFQSSQAQAMSMSKLGLSTKPKLRSSSSFNGGAVQQNKDLDSSTSNEIFSRRRGLQQHQRSTQPKAQLTFNSLLANPSISSLQTTNQTNIIAAGQRLPFPATNTTSYMSAIQRQMEENKRKYIVQQQQLMATPTLSVQKANLIKAKLGLTVYTKPNSWQQQQFSFNQKTTASAAAASSNNIITADPTSGSELNADKNNLNSIVSNSNGQLIGAPLNSIPKTDFECTDKKGKFISGLFADYKTGCQVWHLCSNNRKYSFLCPSGTIFNAKLRICDWRYNVKCEDVLPF